MPRRPRPSSLARALHHSNSTKTREALRRMDGWDVILCMEWDGSQIARQSKHGSKLHASHVVCSISVEPVLKQIPAKDFLRSRPSYISHRYTWKMGRYPNSRNRNRCHDGGLWGWEICAKSDRCIWKRTVRCAALAECNSWIWVWSGHRSQFKRILGTWHIYYNEPLVRFIGYASCSIWNATWHATWAYLKSRIYEKICCRYCGRL